MTLKQRVEELEKRVAQLEARPMYVPYTPCPPYQPYNPFPYPTITCQCGVPAEPPKEQGNEFFGRGSEE